MYITGTNIGNRVQCTSIVKLIVTLLRIIVSVVMYCKLVYVTGYYERYVRTILLIL
jgi:hypothetical protein